MFHLNDSSERSSDGGSSCPIVPCIFCFHPSIFFFDVFQFAVPLFLSVVDRFFVSHSLGSSINFLASKLETKGGSTQDFVDLSASEPASRDEVRPIEGKDLGDGRMGRRRADAINFIQRPVIIV